MKKVFVLVLVASLLALSIPVLARDCCTCSNGWLDSYRCNGNNLERQYQYSDCDKEWRSVEYCNYGCENNQCLPKACDSCECEECKCEECGCEENCCKGCNVQVSVESPGDVFLGETVSTKIAMKNDGGSGSNVKFYAYMCTDNENYCSAMDCNDGPVTYLPSGETKEITCKAKTTETCMHKIKVVYSGCNGDTTVYSNNFEVKQAKCQEVFTNEFMCVNDWLMRKYQLGDCTFQWKQYMSCPYGCDTDRCLDVSEVNPIVAQVSMDESMNVKNCEISKFNFAVKNTGGEGATFKLVASGKLSEWIHLQSQIELEPKEEKTVEAYMSIPCDIEGSYNLTISAIGDKQASASSYVTITSERYELFAVPWSTIGYLFIVVVVISFFVWLSKKMVRFPKGKPEGFKLVKNLNLKFDTKGR